MKNLKKIVVAIVMFVATSSFVNAQNNVAHINVQKLLSEMPAMKNAQAELQKLQETYRADIENSIKELQNKVTQYQNEAASKSDEENKKRQEELAGFEKSIAQAQQTAQQELQKKQVELVGPVTETAKKAIEKVAAAQGMNYVFDSTQGGGVIVATGKDLLADVKKELGF